MLVLTRHPNESILIGNDVEVMVIAVTGNSARLRIATPRMTPVVREQVLHLDRSIAVGDDIEIMIVEVRGCRVRLGITAPNDFPIRREEARQEPSRGSSTSFPP